MVWTPAESLNASEGPHSQAAFRAFGTGGGGGGRQPPPHEGSREGLCPRVPSNMLPAPWKTAKHFVMELYLCLNSGVH